MTKRILRELRIDKVAAVDAPCQEHASADIMKRVEPYEDFCKRKFTAEQRREAAANGHAMSDGSYPINDTEDLENAIHAIGRGSGSHAAIRAHIISRARALGATGQLPDDWKKVAPTESNMLKELAKALGLPETATEAEITKAMTDHITKTATMSAELATAQALAKMSDKHKAFMEGGGKMPKGGKEAFQAMTPAERDAHCAENDDDDDDAVSKALKAGDAFKTPEGIVVRKAKVGEELFTVLKNQNDALVKAKKDAEKAKEEKDEEDMKKRATDIGFGADFGPTLRKAYGGDATAQAEVEKRIKGLKEQVEQGGLFSNFGKSSPMAGSAEEELLAKVADLRKADPSLTHEQAYSKIYTNRDNADIVKRMKAEAA